MLIRATEAFNPGQSGESIAQGNPTYRLNIVQCLQEGWTYFKRRPFTIIGDLLLMIVTEFALSFLSFLVGTLLSGYRASPERIFLIALIPFLLLVVPLVGGMHRYLLNAARDSALSVTDALAGFRRFFPLIISYLCIIAAIVVGMTPIWICELHFPPLDTIANYVGRDFAGVIFYVIAPLLVPLNFAAVMIVLTRFAMVFFIIMDDDKISVVNAFRRSASISKGNTWRLVGLFMASSLIAVALTGFLIIPVLSIGMFLFVAYARAYLNLREAVNG